MLKKPELLNNFQVDFLTRDTPWRFFELWRVTPPEEIVKKMNALADICIYRLHDIRLCNLSSSTCKECLEI